MSKKEKAAENINEKSQDAEIEIEKTVESDAEMKTEGKEEADSDSDALKKELEDIKDKHMRLAADFQNYKRRTESEKSDIAAFANERIAKDLLNVMDNFERAMSNALEGDGFAEGVKLIYKQLSDVLTNFNIAEIVADGAEFDPNFHHAVLSEEVEGIESGKVIEVMQKGYTLNGKVIRASMVKVSA